MEKHQDQKFICKICGKSCVSGNSLGGHMRSHVPRKSAKITKIEVTKLSFKDDDDNDESPNKSSSTVSNASNTTVIMHEGEVHCRECGKEFPSTRALFGHMRWHSKKSREEEYHVCKECGEEFDSSRALVDHMRHHCNRVSNESEESHSDDESAIWRKRSRTKMISSSHDLDADEIKEAAIVLMMISMGMTERNYKKLSFKQKELGTWASFSSSGFGKNRVESDDIDSLFSGNDKNKVEAFDDEFYGRNQFEEANVDDGFGIGISSIKTKSGKRKRIESEKSFKFEKCNKDSDEITSSNKMMKRRGHACPICFRVFRSRKGLGSHKKAHKLDVFENRFENSMPIKQETDDVGNVFDLNDDLGFKLSWVRRGRKREPWSISN